MQSWSLVGHMPCPHYMQFWSLQYICHALIKCSFWAWGTYAMPSLHTVLELVWHMPCHHYMQFWNIYWAYDMPSLNAISELVIHMPCPPVIALYCFMLLCITLYYFVLCCILSLIDPMGLTPCGLQDMHYAIITCGSGAWVSICCTLVTCNSVAWEAHVMPSLHVVSGLTTHMAYPLCMQFWSLRGICHTAITCRSGVHKAHAMPL